MQIDFFEEFMTDENLAQAKRIDFDSIIYLAAKNLVEFRKSEARLRAVNKRVRAAYWPLLAGSYWLSPFSFPEEVKRVHEELLSEANANRRLELLLDLELPIMKPLLFLRNGIHLRKNRKMIQDICRLPHNFLSSEYPSTGRIMDLWMRLLGISVEEVPSCVMYYTSMLPNWIMKPMQSAIMRRAQTENKQNLGLGCLASGILGNEPVMSPDALKRDLQFAKNIGVRRVILFRLGGLTEDFFRIIRPFI